MSRLSLRARILAILLGVTALGAGIVVRVALQSEPSRTNASATRATTTSTSTTSTTMPPTTTTLPPPTVAPKPVVPKPTTTSTTTLEDRMAARLARTRLTFSSTIPVFEGSIAEINQVVSRYSRHEVTVRVTDVDSHEEIVDVSKPSPPWRFEASDANTDEIGLTLGSGTITKCHAFNKGNLFVPGHTYVIEVIPIGQRAAECGGPGLGLRLYDRTTGTMRDLWSEAQ